MMTRPERRLDQRGLQPEADEQRVDLGEHHRAGDGAEKRAAPADQRRAADHHGRDGLEEIGLADVAIGRAGETEQQDAGDGGEERAEREGDDPHPERADQRQRRGARVAAEREQPAAIGRAVEHEDDQDHRKDDEGGDQPRYRDRPDRTADRDELGHRIGSRAGGEAARPHQHRALDDGADAEGDDERMKAEPGRDRAVERADAEREHADDRRRPARSSCRRRRAAPRRRWRSR